MMQHDEQRATVILFRTSGKYYTEETWRIPEGAIGPFDMDKSPDFRRISGGQVLIPTQEPWGYPHLFPSEAQLREPNITPSNLELRVRPESRSVSCQPTKDFMGYDELELVFGSGFDSWKLRIHLSTSATVTLVDALLEAIARMPKASLELAGKIKRLQKEI